MAYKQLKLWFDKDLALLLSNKLKEVHPNFDSNLFINRVEKGVDKLELKDRVAFIAQQLHICFDEEYHIGRSSLMQILGPENKEETGMFSNFYWIIPIAKYVEDYGRADFSNSMNALVEITKRTTSEYAIRPYIKKFPDKTIKKMLKWSKNKNAHVRRLASEGGRPRLPWASKLQMFIDDPQPLLPILHNLKNDESKYVQKSVANCVNDIIKDNVLTGKELIESWIPNSTNQSRWIIKHAIRNLLKAGDPWAIDILAEINM